MQTDFGRSPRLSGLICGLLDKHPGTDRATVRGSGANGKYPTGPDIDLTQDAPRLAFSGLLRTNAGFDNLVSPCSFDLSLLKQIKNPELLEHISRVGKPLCFKSERHAG